MNNIQFALRICRYDGNSQRSGKPDGAFLKNDGHLTDAKTSAKVFETEQDAELWFTDLLKTSPKWQVHTPGVNVWVVPVVTKAVIKTASATPLKKLI